MSAIAGCYNPADFTGGTLIKGELSDSFRYQASLPVIDASKTGKHDFLVYGLPDEQFSVSLTGVCNDIRELHAQQRTSIRLLVASKHQYVHTRSGGALDTSQWILLVRDGDCRLTPTQWDNGLPYKQADDYHYFVFIEIETSTLAKPVLLTPVLTWAKPTKSP